MQIAASVAINTEQLRKDMQAPEIDRAIKLSQELADKLGINGTPTFIIGDQLSPGALGLDALESQVANVRQNGCRVC